jgi:hypothetical protein
MLRDASDPWRFLRLVLISRVHLRKGSKILPSMDDDGMLPFRSLSLSLSPEIFPRKASKHTGWLTWRATSPISSADV